MTLQSYEVPHEPHSSGKATGSDPSVLQACDITGGLYLKVPQMPSLLQYLLVSQQQRPPTSRTQGRDRWGK